MADGNHVEDASATPRIVVGEAGNGGIDCGILGVGNGVVGASVPADVVLKSHVHMNGSAGPLKNKSEKSDEIYNGVGSSMEVDPEEDGEPCGWGPIQPKCCQRFRNAKVVLFFLCCLAIIQGMVVNGFVSVVISTIEKRFDLTSLQAGIIASGYDIASILCLIPVSYFGGMGNKPRWIVGGVFLISLGSFLFALPHFLVDLYSYEIIGQKSLCRTDLGFSNYTHSDDCHLPGSDNSPPATRYMYMLIAAQMLHGAGATPIYTLAVTYLDENLKAKLTPIYLGIFYSTAIIGPAVGYIVGGQLLKLYVDVGWVNMTSIDLTPEDPQWVGAWWIGFLLSGSLAFLLALPLSGFPRSMPGAAKLQLNRVSEVYNGSDVVSTNPGFRLRLKDIPASIIILLKNPTFMALNFAGACEGFLISGFVVFAPKFVESQFTISAAWAAQLIGMATIPSGGGGTLLGGYLVKRLNLKCKGILRLCMVTTAAALFLALMMLLRCEDMKFAGVNAHYSESNMSLSQEANLSSLCNLNCHCTKELYEPVCGDDRLIYFSSCFAGCTDYTLDDEGFKIFNNCSCITSSSLSQSAFEGKCESPCQLVVVFLPIFALIIFVTFVTSMPALSATLRCVPEKQRSFALGIQWILFRCLGMIPAPILFGALIDRTCLSWQELPCTGERGSCFTYDNWSMGTYLLALVFTCKGLSLFFFVFAHFLYRPPPTTSRSLISETNVTTSTTCTDWNSPSSILLDQKSTDDVNVTLVDKKSTTNP